MLLLLQPHLCHSANLLKKAQKIILILQYATISYKLIDFLFILA